MKRNLTNNQRYKNTLQMEDQKKKDDCRFLRKNNESQMTI